MNHLMNQALLFVFFSPNGECNGVLDNSLLDQEWAAPPGRCPLWSPDVPQTCAPARAPACAPACAPARGLPTCPRLAPPTCAPNLLAPDLCHALERSCSRVQFVSRAVPLGANSFREPLLSIPVGIESNCSRFELESRALLSIRVGIESKCSRFELGSRAMLSIRIGIESKSSRFE